MKTKLFYFLLSSSIICNLSAMDPEETNIPVQQKTQSSRKPIITEQDWQQLEAFYNEGYRETPLNLSFSAEQRHQ